MDYGGCDKRRTKKDLKRKRLARGYKRGGQLRTIEIKSSSDDEGSDGNNKTKKKKGKRR